MCETTAEGEFKTVNHTCLPIPLAPDPIRVQPCVRCIPIEFSWR